MCKLKQQKEIEKLPEPHETTENDSDDDDSDDDSDDSQDENDSEEMTDTDEPHRSNLSPDRIKQIDVNLMMFIIKSYQPVGIVEQEGFTLLSSIMNAGYVMPKRKDITKRILPEMYNRSLEEKKIFVKKNAESVCLTLDRWKTSNEELFMSIMAHFITSDFQFQSVLLKVHSCELNAENLKRVLTETCTEWGISDKINCCVSNDVAQMDNDEWTAPAINSLGWGHIDCVGYKLNTILYNCLQSCSNILIKVQNIIGYFESSLKSRQKMEEYQAKEGVAEPLDFFYLDEKNWTCRYDMLERFVLLKEPFEAVLAEQTDIHLPGITNVGWTQLEQILKLLKPFREVTREMVINKYVAASKVIPFVNCLKQELHKTPKCYTRVKKLINCLDREMNEQFKGIESNPNLALCTILDHRYKTSMFLDKNAEEQAKLRLVSEVEELMDDHDDPMGLVKTDGGPNMAIDDDGVELRHFGQLSRRLAQKEVESYLQEEEEEEELSPCTWWQNNKSKFPHIAKLFQTRCNNIATSIPTEYIFTEIGIELYQRKNTMSLRKAAMIIFLNHNLKDTDYFRLMPDSDQNVMEQ